MILEKMPPAPGDPDAPLQILVSNIDHDDYVGRLAIGRIVAGTVRANQPVGVIKDGRTVKATIKVLSTFEGLKRTPADGGPGGRDRRHRRHRGRRRRRHHRRPGARAGKARALPRIHVEQPTIKMRIGVNTSPFAGKSKQSKFLTSRHLRERLAARDEAEPRHPRRGDRLAGHVRACSAAASCSSRSSSRRCAAKATRCSSATPRS